MKAATRRKVSYVVKLCNEEQTHCLGVNSLAIDTSNCNAKTDNAEGGVLYSAGRDGIVASWDLHMDFKRNTDEKWKLDGETKASAEGEGLLFVARTHAMMYTHMYTLVGFTQDNMQGIFSDAHRLGQRYCFM